MIHRVSTDCLVTFYETLSLSLVATPILCFVLYSADTYIRGYNGQQVRADIVAVLEGEQDIGWSRNANGSFDMIADLPGVGRKKNVAELTNALNQKYAINQTLTQVKQRGLQTANVKLVLQN